MSRRRSLIGDFLSEGKGSRTSVPVETQPSKGGRGGLFSTALKRLSDKAQIRGGPRSTSKGAERKPKQLFAYSGVDTYGRHLKGLVQAKDKDEAEYIVRTSGLVKYTIRKLSPLELWMVNFFYSVNDKQIAIYTRELAEMFKSGLPITKIFEMLAFETLNPRLSLISMMAKEYIRNGYPLSKVFAENSDIFSGLYVGMVKLGEATGELSEVMDALASYVQADFELKERIKSALTYPAVVIVIATLIVWGLITFIFPKFMAIIKDLNVSLPWYSRVLVQISNLLSNGLFMATVFLVGILGYLIVRVLLRYSHSFRRLYEQLLITIPVIGRVVKKLLIARFAKAMVVTFRSGLPLMISMDYLKESIGSAIIYDICDHMKEVLREGGSFSTAIQDISFFPLIVRSIVEAGEQTGELEAMLDKLAELFDFEVKADLDMLSSLLEPLIIFFLGTVVAFILLGVYGPLLTILQSIR